MWWKRFACLTNVWSLWTILCIKNQHAEVTCQNPLGFLTSGAGPLTSKNDKISASKFFGAAILTKQGPGPVFSLRKGPPSGPPPKSKTLQEFDMWPPRAGFWYTGWTKEKPEQEMHSIRKTCGNLIDFDPSKQIAQNLNVLFRWLLCWSFSTWCDSPTDWNTVILWLDMMVQTN